MQLKHMPCGAHYFQDYGYQRYPLHPLQGEEIWVGLLIENTHGEVTALLQWEKDGITMPVVTGQRVVRSGDERLYFRFSLGQIDDLCNVAYSFCVKDEKESLSTRSYHFAVLVEEGLGQPLHLLQGDRSAYAVFKRLTMCFDWSNGLRVYTLAASDQIEGKAVKTIHAQVKEDIALHICSNPFFWQLKRSTTVLVECEAGSYRLIVDRAGLVHQIRYAPHVLGKHIIGMGERFDQVDQQGNTLLLRIVEHFAHQGKNTYLPIPFFMTEEGIGWLSSTRRRLWFDASDGLQLSFETPQKGILSEEWWLLGKPKTILAQLHAITGRAVLPPKWAFGIWMSSNGWNSQKDTMEQLDALEKHMLPATVLVLEAWSDEQTFCIFNDAEYEPLDQEEPYKYEDFTFPQHGRWPNPKGLAKAVEDAGLNLVLWQIPVIKYAWEGAGPQLLRDEAYAIEQGYCVMNDDGTPYRVTDNWFKNSLLLDFTKPEAVKWWFGKRAYLVDTLGVRGFKTDGGEFLFDDTSILHDGQTGETAHNAYPLQYVAAYRDFLHAHGVQGVTFSRAGYTGAQTLPIHWAGDQLSEWSEFRAQLTAGISAGLSGIPFWSFDIGGFGGDFPSPELYLRSVAMAAFSPVMQWHSESRDGQFYDTAPERWNNDRSPWNLASVHSDERILSVYRLFANLRMNLLPYIYQEARHCADTARPLMAHLLIDYPDDDNAWRTHDQYMFGRNLLIAPILQEGAAGRQIYLPEGMWHDLFLGGTIDGGQTIDYRCPIERLPVFVRDGAALPINMNTAGIIGTQQTSGGVGNDLTRYVQLAFLCFGDASCEFEDDLGNRLSVRDGRVHGTGIAQVLLVNASTSETGDDIRLFGRSLAAQTVVVEKNTSV